MPVHFSIPSIIIGSHPRTFDTNAQAYFDAVAAASGTLTRAAKFGWDAYIKAIKDNGTFTKRKLILGISGGNAASHAIDVISAASKISNSEWSSGVVHNASGAKGNGTTGYGDINFNPSSDFSSTLVGFGIYARTDEEAACWEMGVEQGSGAGAFLSQLRSSGGTGGASFSRVAIGDYDAGVQAIENPDIGPWNGYICGNKFSNSSIKSFRNGAVLATDSSSNTGALTNAHVYALALNLIGTGVFGFSTKQICMIQFWEGMTEAEIIADNILVEALQDSQNRGVQ